MNLKPIPLPCPVGPWIDSDDGSVHYIAPCEQQSKFRNMTLAMYQEQNDILNVSELFNPNSIGGAYPYAVGGPAPPQYTGDKNPSPPKKSLISPLNILIVGLVAGAILLQPWK